MKLFSSVSLDYQGRKCSGHFEAEDEVSARNMLMAQGYHVVEIREVVRKNAEAGTDVFSRGRYDLPRGVKKHLTLALGIAMGITAICLAFNIIRSGAFAPEGKALDLPSSAVVRTAVSKPVPAGAQTAAGLAPAVSSSDSSGEAAER